jgi:hypothetical protein
MIVKQYIQPLIIQCIYAGKVVNQIFHQNLIALYRDIGGIVEVIIIVKFFNKIK